MEILTDRNADLIADREVHMVLAKMFDALIKQKEGEPVKKAVFQEGFHGETWYKCPYCSRSFEYFTALFERDGFKRVKDISELRSVGGKGDFNDYKHYYIECPDCHNVFDLG